MTRKQKKLAVHLVTVTAPGAGSESRRIAALRCAGFRVEYHSTAWNFGRSCDYKEVKGGLLMQLAAAKGRRTRSGHHVNACPLYLVSK